MTGIVLALAGLTAGDGGTGMGAATAPVAFSGVEGAWEGKVETVRGGCCAALRSGVLCTSHGSAVNGEEHPWRIRIDGVGTLTLTDDRGRRYPGIYKREGPRLLICFGKARRPSAYRPDEHGACLITLSLTVPRKP